MVDHTPPAAAGIPSTIAPLTARLACRITTDRRSAGISAPALADELLDLVARYVEETPVEKLDPRLQHIFAVAGIRALELVEQRAAAARAAKRRVIKAARHVDDQVVIIDLEQQDLEYAGVPLHVRKASERELPPEQRRGVFPIVMNAGCSDDQLRILRLLDEHGHRTFAEIANCCEHPHWKGSVEWRLGKLIAAGFVAGEDLGGPTMYALTPAGQAELARSLEARRA